ncbi:MULTISPECIES: endolytic transglycosylase MltG [unclassified Afipia]|uniref:endolytic transglycosylase MltG n=1 Tax=unclassified Afipia TaxID=2642050 RepID=UPI00046476C6|nr:MULTISPECIES: endolytic transglycosylase MltG [unclassified Afipia]
MSQRPPIAPRSPRAALEPEQVPQPPKHSQRARSTLVVVGNAIFTFLIVAMLLAGGAFFYGKKTIEAKGPLAEDKVVNIPPRAGMTDIGDILQRAGVINADRWTFIGSVLAMNARSGLKSGEYLFQKNASLRDVINTIVEGKVVQHAITIPEGLTSEQIVARLQDNDIFSGSLKEQPREGTLLPDTYNFPRGTPRDQVIHRMQQAQKKVLAEVWARRNPDIPVRSPEQLVTLASIVEKETGRADERSRVAAVFTNRLRQRIKLQSDPTIIYGLVGGKGTLGRPIKRSEITQPSPYNTYVIEGLPPGPIANPGRASLEATANPARTRDLFFVADGTGGHSFTETYDQHQKGVAKLRAMERQQQNDTVDADDQPPVAAVPAPAAGAPAAAAPAKPPASAAPKAAPKATAPKASAPASIMANEPAADGAAARKRTAKRTPAAAPAEPEPEEEKTQ